VRIVSLLPSATEMLCALELGDQLCGVSHECDYPESVQSLPKVTRSLIPSAATSGQIDAFVRQQTHNKAALYSLDTQTLEALSPDLIVTQSLCDVCAVADEEVRIIADRLPRKPQVINLQPDSLESVLEAMKLIGDSTRRTAQAHAAVARLQKRIDDVSLRTQQWLSKTGHRRPRVMMLEWLDPPFTAGHWTPELVSIAGGREVLGIAGKRSVTTNWQAIV